MPIKTSDLGLPENLEKLNFVVGKIIGKRRIHFIAEKCFHGTLSPAAYSPTTDANQCFEATPLCEIRISFGHPAQINGKCYRAKIYGADYFSSMGFVSELIARCIALVYSVYGNEVPDEVFTS